MKAVEFETTLAADGMLTVPPSLVNEIPAGEQVRIVVMWDGARLDEDWRALVNQRLEEAYAPEDSVYERLMDDPSIR